MDHRATAKWAGDLKSGNGTMRLGSGAFEGPYSFRTRFEGAPGTNPEELLGAAHAGCFSMALSARLSKAGFTPRTIQTTATVHLNKVGEGFGITGIDLATRCDVPGVSESEFHRLAADAKANCIISKALAVPIQLEASLISAAD